MTPNMASAIIAAADDPPRAGRQARSRRALVARLLLPEVTILAWVSAIDGDAMTRRDFDAAEIASNPFFCPDKAAAALGSAG